jgi:hypothetical protein
MSQELNNTEDPIPSITLIRSREAEAQFDTDILVVQPYQSWNDFGYLIRAEVGLRTGSGNREWFDAFFALKEEKNLAAFVKDRLPEKMMGIPLRDVGLPFASLLTESKNYSLVRRSIGAHPGLRLLLELHDVSLLHSEDEDVPDWPDFFVADVFTHAITRSSEGHFAYRHGALVLAGRRTSGVDARQNISVDLTRYGPKLHFIFSSIRLTH